LLAKLKDKYPEQNNKNRKTYQIQNIVSRSVLNGSQGKFL